LVVKSTVHIVADPVTNTLVKSTFFDNNAFVFAFTYVDGESLNLRVIITKYSPGNIFVVTLDNASQLQTANDITLQSQSLVLILPDVQ
jgi:hypothetical protein